MKRSLKKQNQEAEKKILKDNADIYNDIVRQYYPPKHALDRRRILLRVGSVAFACLLLIGVLTVVFAKAFREEPTKYLLQNEVVEKFDVNEFYKKFAWLKTDDDWDIITVYRTYDSVSGDNLYFEALLMGNSFAEIIDIYLYINPDYQNRLTISGEPVDYIKINDIDIKYKGGVSVDSDFLYNFDYFAQFDKDNADIYIKYQQTWYQDDTHFFEFLKEITL